MDSLKFFRLLKHQLETISQIQRERLRATNGKRKERDGKRKKIPTATTTHGTTEENDSFCMEKVFIS